MVRLKSLFERRWKKTHANRENEWENRFCGLNVMLSIYVYMNVYGKLYLLLALVMLLLLATCVRDLFIFLFCDFCCCHNTTCDFIIIIIIIIFLFVHVFSIERELKDRERVDVWRRVVVHSSSSIGIFFYTIFYT